MIHICFSINYYKHDNKVFGDEVTPRLDEAVRVYLICLPDLRRHTQVTV